MIMSGAVWASRSHARSGLNSSCVFSLVSTFHCHTWGLEGPFCLGEKIPPSASNPHSSELLPNAWRLCFREWGWADTRPWSQDRKPWPLSPPTRVMGVWTAKKEMKPFPFLRDSLLGTKSIDLQHPMASGKTEACFPEPRSEGTHGTFCQLPLRFLRWCWGQSSWLDSGWL